MYYKELKLRCMHKERSKVKCCGSLEAFRLEKNNNIRYSKIPTLRPPLGLSKGGL